MATKKKSGPMTRDAPTTTIAMTSEQLWQIALEDGYKPATSCPEVQMCVNVYADLIGSMTIHLMANAEGGDMRIKNGLSAKLDIDPNHTMTRTPFIQYIVRDLLLHGNAVVLPVFKSNLLDELIPLPASQCSFIDDQHGSYVIRYKGMIYQPDEVLHFVLTPDENQPWRGTGYNVSLSDMVKSIRQANSTKQALLKSPAPSVIVKVDGLTEEFASVEGRKKLREQYVDSSESGEPWFIPAEAFSVEQVKPLTLNDLAIKDNLELDKRSVAAIFGVPAFMVGVGEFRQDEYQYFLSTRVMAKVRILEQELTNKLLISDQMYWKFNARSLYNYSINDLINAGKEMVDRMAMRRNEWRDWLGMSPDPEMDDLLALENYIPADRLGDQKKLEGGGETDE